MRFCLDLFFNCLDYLMVFVMVSLSLFVWILHPMFSLCSPSLSINTNRWKSRDQEDLIRWKVLPAVSQALWQTISPYAFRILERYPCEAGKEMWALLIFLQKHTPLSTVGRGRCLGPCSFEGGRGGVKNDRHNFLEARQAGEQVNWLPDHN